MPFAVGCSAAPANGARHGYGQPFLCFLFPRGPQLPRMGRTKGPNSNSALRKELDAEGTAWLGCGAAAGHPAACRSGCADLLPTCCRAATTAAMHTPLCLQCSTATPCPACAAACRGECMTVQLTFSYCMDPDTCLADSCSLIWGAVHGLHLRGERKCCSLRGALQRWQGGVACWPGRRTSGAPPGAPQAACCGWAGDGPQAPMPPPAAPLLPLSPPVISRLPYAFLPRPLLSFLHHPQR